VVKCMEGVLTESTVQEHWKTGYVRSFQCEETHVTVIVTMVCE
jgi:hypothetical protein